MLRLIGSGPASPSHGLSQSSLWRRSAEQSEQAPAQGVEIGTGDPGAGQIFGHVEVPRVSLTRSGRGQEFRYSPVVPPGCEPPTKPGASHQGCQADQAGGAAAERVSLHECRCDPHPRPQSSPGHLRPASHESRQTDEMVGPIQLSADVGTTPSRPPAGRHTAGRPRCCTRGPAASRSRPPGPDQDPAPRPGWPPAPAG